MALNWSTLNIIFEGDSLTARNAANGNAPIPQAGNVADNLEGLQPTATYHNIAADGHRTNQISAASVNALIDGGKTNVVFTLIGTNDWLQGRTAAAAYADLEVYWDAITGAELMIAFTIPSANAPSGVANFWNDYNNLIRAGHAAHGWELIDMAAIAEFQDNQNTDIFNADRVHWTQLGIDSYALLDEAKIEAELGDSMNATTLNATTLRVG